ncbi:MAG: TolC family protein [Lewinellaceae bacterium]|nr:TolC family protein [Lewinellaceae bacterium]
MKCFLYVLLLLQTRLLTAQIGQAGVDNPGGFPTLDWTNFRRQVLENHPVARQADLSRDEAAATLLRARGGFDPKAFADYSAKNFNDKNYFQFTEAGLKWPAGLGLEFKGAFNYATGEYLNPESKLPSDGQAAFGFNWTLGQGLFIDERRAAMRQARIGIQQAEAERSAVLNHLLLDAAKVYWSWVVADNQLVIYEEALRQAGIRHNALRESLLQGDKPAIDTLESFIQVQNRLLDVNFARVEQQNALLAVQNFLWSPDSQTFVPETNFKAPALLSEPFAAGSPGNLAELLQQAQAQHPELLMYEAKLRSLDVERRLKNEKRKPMLDLSYQLLGAGWQFFPAGGPDGAGVLAGDIKWGLHFSYPILNRKARGDLQITEIKLAQTDYELRLKRQTIDNKIRQYGNELNNLAQQITLYRDMTQNYRLLLDAENEKFRFGESSIFLINTREQRWLDARIKYLKLLSEFRKTEAALNGAAGNLAN